MPSYDLLLPFFVATSVFAFVPGPGMFYAAAQTIARGRRAGWLSALGLHLGGYAHIAAAAFGLTLLLEAVPALYTVVKLAGAAYLIWLGIGLLTSRRPTDSRTVEARARSRRAALRQSIVVEVLNPKTALFYLAFLPQFTDVSAPMPVWGQVLVLGAVVNVMFSATDALCILLSHKLTTLFAASRSASRLARRIGGGTLVALGVGLAASRQ